MVFLKQFPSYYWRIAGVYCVDEMAVSDEYRLKAAEFRAKAHSLRDPLFRSMFARLAKRYSRLADQAEEADRKDRAKLPYKSSPPIASRRLGKRQRVFRNT